MERRLIPILLDMERHGVKVDADDLRRMSVDFEKRMVVMEREDAIAWSDTNSMSAAQSNWARNCSTRWACRVASA